MGAIAPDMLGQLFRRHAAALRLYARQWVADADDIVQDAFLTLARQETAPRQIPAWLYSVVRNGALAAVRGDTRRRRRESTVGTGEAWFSHVDDRLDAREATRALAELSLEQREVIVARLWGGLTFEEVAQLVGCSLPTAHRRYHTGLSELQRRLEGTWTTTRSRPTT